MVFLPFVNERVEVDCLIPSFVFLLWLLFLLALLISIFPSNFQLVNIDALKKKATVMCSHLTTGPKVRGPLMQFPVICIQ